MTINKTLCELNSQGFVENHLKKYKKLVRHSLYVCKSCGRTARRKRNLCTPRCLYPEEKPGK